jgi:L-threonylcarbamoyladenylate synthase
MERLSVDDPSAPARAAQIMAAGGVILYPTDTLYGLGADALSDAAVAKIYSIKERDEKKPMHAVVADMAMVEQYGVMNGTAIHLAEKFLPGPLTLILKKKEGIDTGIASGIDTFGIRIPDNLFCLQLARAFGRPFTTTSANISALASKQTVDEIIEQLGDRTAMIDLVIDAGELPERLPSTIVDVSGDTVAILREGAIAAKDIS